MGDISLVLFHRTSSDRDRLLNFFYLKTTEENNKRIGVSGRREGLKSKVSGFIKAFLCESGDRF